MTLEQLESTFGIQSPERSPFTMLTRGCPYHTFSCYISGSTKSGKYWYAINMCIQVCYDGEPLRLWVSSHSPGIEGKTGNEHVWNLFFRDRLHQGSDLHVAWDGLVAANPDVKKYSQNLMFNIRLRDREWESYVKKTRTNDLSDCVCAFSLEALIASVQ